MKMRRKHIPTPGSISIYQKSEIKPSHTNAVSAMLTQCQLSTKNRKWLFLHLSLLSVVSDIAPIMILEGGLLPAAGGLMLACRHGK